MKYVLAVAIVALGLYSLAAGGASAHHNTNHSLGPCGTVQCPIGK